MADLTISLNFDPDWLVNSTKEPDFCDKGRLRSIYQTEILGRYSTICDQIVPTVLRKMDDLMEEPFDQDVVNVLQNTMNYLMQTRLLHLLYDSDQESYDAFTVIAHLSRFDDVMHLLRETFSESASWGIFAMVDRETREKLIYLLDDTLSDSASTWSRMFESVARAEGDTGLHDHFESEFSGIIRGMNACLDLDLPDDEPLFEVEPPQRELTREDYEQMIGRDAIPQLPNDPTGGVAFDQNIPLHYENLQLRILPQMVDTYNRLTSAEVDLITLQIALDLYLQYHLLLLIHDTDSEDTDAITVVSHIPRFADLWDWLSDTEEEDIDWIDYALADLESREELLSIVEEEALTSGMDVLIDFLTTAERSAPDAHYTEQINAEVTEIVRNMSICLGLPMDLSTCFVDPEPEPEPDADPLDSLPQCRPLSAYHSGSFRTYTDPALQNRGMNTLLYIDGRISHYSPPDTVPCFLFKQQDGTTWIMQTSFKHDRLFADGSVFDDLQGIDVRVFGCFAALTNDGTPIVDIAISGGVLVCEFGAFFCTDLFDALLQKAGLSRQDFIDFPG